MITLLGNNAVKLIVPQYVPPTPPAPAQVIYGVKLDKTMNNNKPLGASWATYTDDAVGLNGAYMDFQNDTFVDNGWLNRFPFNQIKPCMVKDGAVVGYLDPNDYTKYADGTPSNNNNRSSGNVMIEVPKIYYKISEDNTYIYIQISNQMFTGACCLAHVYKGDELDKIYVDAYLTGDRNYQTYGPCSIAGLRAAPESFSLGYANMYPEIKEHRGDRCECFTYNLFTLFGCLFAVMFKSTNARTSLGLGLEKYTVNMVVTGVADQKGMYYGSNYWTSGDPEQGRIKLFGMEDYYGAKYTYVAGFYVDTNTDNPRVINPYDSTSGYATTDFENYPEIVLQNSDKPIDRNLKLVPIRIAGMNNIGFTRANVSVDPTVDASYNDCGFCSTTRYAATSTYVIGCMAMGFNTDAGVYSFNTYSTNNTTRRGFRIVYYPPVNNNN